MESIYKLGEKYNNISYEYETIKGALECMYEENGGEETAETEAMQKELDKLGKLREEIIKDVLSAPDEFAAIVKNAESQKNILEAELKALKEEQAKACAKIEARIKHQVSKMEWFKQNIADAMKMAEIEKIGGAKTSNKFTIWFAKSESVEADSEIVLKPYTQKVQEFIDSLPSYISVKTDINKKALKENLKDENAVHPDGAVLLNNKTLQIR